MFALLVSFTLNGQVQTEETPMPDYKTCQIEKERWLKYVNRLWVKDPKAYCIARFR